MYVGEKHGNNVTVKMSESAFSGRPTPSFSWNLQQKRNSRVWQENLFSSHLSFLGTRYPVWRTDCHLTTCTGFWTAWSGLCYVVDERLCWYSSREILVESSSKAFNSREVRHCLMCSEKEINFLAVKYAREVAAKHDLRFLRHKTRQDIFKYVENRIRGPG